MVKKQFSIIIPAFNYAHLLSRAVSSVLTQAGDDFELIIIDDGSTDDTEKVVERWKEKYPDVLRYYRQKNQGAATARNKGLDLCEGDFVILLDADDELMDGALSYFRQAVENEPGSDLFLGGHQTIDESGKQREHPVQQVSSNSEKNFAAYLNKKLSISHGAFAANKELFNKIRYPEALTNGEDIPVFGQLLAHAKVFALNQLLVRIHKHQESQRHKIESNDQATFLIVDRLFDHSVLPSVMWKYKKLYVVRRYLSLARSYYLMGHYVESREWFIKAVKKRPQVLFRLSYLRKFLKASFKRKRR